MLFITMLLSAVTQGADAIVLQTSVLKLLDGVWPAFDGDTLYKMSWLMVRYDVMLNGKIVNKETKERQGLYKFNGNYYGIKDLAAIEQNNKDNAKVQKDFQEILKSAKREFLDLNRVFIKQIQSQKQFVVKIMQESCDRRNIPNSYMLKWAETPFGAEEESFDQNMTSFTELNKFMFELRNFLGDLFESCPKGYAQYLEIIKKQRANRAGA